MADPDPTAELLRQNAALYDRFLAENAAIEQAFLARTPSAFGDALRAIGAAARGELPAPPPAEEEKKDEG